MQATTGLEDGLKRDVAILSTLAHLHCGTVQHLHALCFPHRALATVRTSLHYLAAAGFVAQSTWQTRRVSRERGQDISRERGQIWMLTPKGHDLLQQHILDAPPLAWIDLARPSTAIEHEEWHVQLDVRTLLVRLLLEARCTALLNYVELYLPGGIGWPWPWRCAACPQPDALISILWHPAICQSVDWLPWVAPAENAVGATHYPIYLERIHSQFSVTEIVRALAQTPTEPLHIPVVILQSEDHYASTYHQLAALPHLSPIRLATWTALEGGIAQEWWRNEEGITCGLHP